MWYEIFKFELKYRIKRPETYAFFIFLFLFSIVGVDFIFQGVEIGLMKKNAPLVIAKTMGAITGIFMIMTSMIMGVPILRDFQYQIESLVFVNPISKHDYLLGRFLGSFTILLFIFSGLLFGMMVGSQMPWHSAEEMLAFNPLSYIQTFVVVALPSLFFGACVFFVTGMLSKKLLVVYTQGIVLFVVFLLTKAITNEYLQGIFDPFSLTTLTQYAKEWTVAERNTTQIGLNGILFFNKLFWTGFGIAVLVCGYRKFSFSTLGKPSRKPFANKKTLSEDKSIQELVIPNVSKHHNLKAKWVQMVALSKFYLVSLLRETSFWAIVICGFIIIAINSVNLGTVYGVDSFPTTYFIIAELQEMSMFFFIIILLFYSGELVWKERVVHQYLLDDATPISSIITLGSKFIALIGIYVVLMLSLIGAGVLFQTINGYYQFDLDVYFAGFFIEILPFLILYTCFAFFFQVISKNKFIGIILTLIFFILNVGSEFLGFNHSLNKFGGKPLGTYSEMNGYGHFLKPYFWVKAYWFIFGILLLIVSGLLMNRGVATRLRQRIKNMKHQISKPILVTSVSLLFVFLSIGSYIFYNTNILNTYWTDAQELNFRMEYEKKLKPFEYIPQPKITDAKLNVELYPNKRSYEVNGTYQLKNTTNEPIHEVHIQKIIASHVYLKDVEFEGEVEVDSTYKKFDYIIYKLKKPLTPGHDTSVKFTQVYTPKGFEDGSFDVEIVENGTFFNNTIFPTLGYNKRYEINSDDDRELMGLSVRLDKATITDLNELANARSGSDSAGLTLDITIGTNKNQTAVTAGNLVKQWSDGNRNYFQYKTDQPVINFYSMVSAEYEIKKDNWTAVNATNNKVDLEIYYHKNHTYNLDRMIDGMKESLTYFSTNFSPYQYQHLRIMEFPRYAEYAQSLPGIIPFSEALGFVLNIDDTTDVDMAFYITAHEVAHQWFGMQIEAANVQGKNLILETLAQYGAIMVLKQKYPQEKVDQFLELQLELYEEKRKKAIIEPSLALVENQDFVYYNKGVLAMYKLQELIGEEQVNLAIQRFIEDWHSYTGKVKTTTKRYATSNDLIEYFKVVTPGSKQYVLTELFEEVLPIELTDK